MIFFKVEANSKIGGGHLYRCLSIAKECSKKGEQCEFIFANSSDSSVQKAIELGFKSHRIKTAEQFDVQIYMKFIPANSLIIFDTDDYRFYSGDLIESLRKEKIYTACFSITDRYLITTDLLINPNIISRTHVYRTGSQTKKCLGPDFFILNENFREKKIYSKPKRIIYPLTLLLIFGNADIVHLTTYFLSIISMLSGYIKKIIVIAGRLNPDIEKVKKQVLSIKEIDIELHIDTKEIIALYKQCDIAITSAGMAMWEMSLFLIPQLVIASTPRELEYTNYLAELNYINKLGDYSSLPTTEDMGVQLKEFFEQKQHEQIKTSEFSRLINPNGIQLIVENFLSL